MTQLREFPFERQVSSPVKGSLGAKMKVAGTVLKCYLSRGVKCS